MIRSGVQVLWEARMACPPLRPVPGSFAVDLRLFNRRMKEMDRAGRKAGDVLRALKINDDQVRALGRQAGGVYRRRAR